MISSIWSPPILGGLRPPRPPKNGPSARKKSSKSRKIIQTSSEINRNHPKIIRKSSNNDSNIIPNSSQHHPKVTPQSSQSHPKITVGGRALLHAATRITPLRLVTLVPNRVMILTNSSLPRYGYMFFVLQ